FHVAALRELREETGLEAGELQPLGEFAYVRETWEEEPGLRVHVEAFLVDVEPGWEPVLDEEHDEYRWLGREEAAELLFWPGPAPRLRALPGGRRGCRPAARPRLPDARAALPRDRRPLLDLGGAGRAARARRARRPRRAARGRRDRAPHRAGPPPLLERGDRVEPRLQRDPAPQRED